MPSYLIYHPARAVSVFDGRTVHYDHASNNQDPYVWNEQFLHTYCHITQMRGEEGQINFWISGGNLRQFTQLFCDLVFVVERKIYWERANQIDRRDPLIDSADAFKDHYRWAMYQHPFKTRRRYTLKADAARSFQPQRADGALLDIVPFLAERGLGLDALRRGLRAGFNSRPMPLGDELARELYDWLAAEAEVRLTGAELRAIRRRHPQLASPAPAGAAEPC
ncbi:MAG TPA: hypothetical protein VGE07_02340 [Herpetosiphonaceae bacterium]